MNWNVPLDESDLEQARPIASATTQVAHDLIAFVTQSVAPTRSDGEGWTGPRLGALFIAAAWEAAQGGAVPMDAKDYVGMLRSHADAVELHSRQASARG